MVARIQAADRSRRRSGGDRGVAGVARGGAGARRGPARPLPHREPHRGGPPRRREPPLLGQHRYLNTIPESRERHTPGDPSIEWRIRSLVRWNAMAMVVQANRESSELGGHIASFASAATPVRGRVQPFLARPAAEHGGDLVYIQGHSAPGIYARAFLEGRLQEEDLHRFRQGGGWKRALVLSPPVAHARVLAIPHRVDGSRTHPGDLPRPVHALPPQPRAAEHRGAQGVVLRRRRGDGRARVARGDHPSPRGSSLDNLVFVVNCNLQRLDGPVRGNGKIIQELEAAFRGAGWNVIKVIWARTGTPS